MNEEERVCWCVDDVASVVWGDSDAAVVVLLSFAESDAVTDYEVGSVEVTWTAWNSGVRF